jgi:hypothetical protein
MRVLAVAAFLLVLPTHANAYSCDDVRWAIQNLSPTTIAWIKKQMTPEQKRQAQDCLRKK